MIWTFYSYKGGVGRSMALANVAEWLYLRNLRVVVIDWDLEAPGLEKFFRRSGAHVAQLPSALGLIDLLGRYRERLPMIDLPQAGSLTDSALQAFDSQLPPLDSYIHPIHAPTDDARSGALHLLPAGWRSDDQFAVYAQAVQDFDWGGFYAQHHGELFFSWLRWRLLAIADVVLIDSRTGISEMSGPGTRQLADVVVSLCAPNQANLDGVLTMSTSFAHPRLIEARGRPVTIVIVPSRIENSETVARNRFELMFRERTAHFTPPGFRANGREFWDLRIPYIPKYAYDEELTIGVPDRAEDLEDAYERLAVSLLELAPAESRLAETRDGLRHDGADVPAAESRRPAIWNLPLRDPLFVGRAAVLDQLRGALTSAGSRVAVCGLPGVGKTALALEYAHRFGSNYQAVWWVRADTTEVIAADLRALATAGGERNGDDPLTWLARNQRWLLILEDADPQHVRELLNPATGGHVIVTSRSLSPSLRALATTLALAPLTTEEGAEFLQQRTGRADHAAARALSSDVGGIPLALRLIADYAEASGRELADVRELFDAQPERVFQRGSDELHVSFGRSFAALERTAPKALELLTLTACLAADAIPLDLLAGGAAHVPETLAATLTNPAARDDAVIALTQHALVTLRGDDVTLHPLVRMLVLERLDRGEREHWHTQVVNAVDAAFPSDPRHPSVWPNCSRLAAHAATVVRAPNASDADGTVPLLTRIAAFDSIEGREDDAERSLALAQQIAGTTGDTDGTIRVIVELAALYALRGDAERARAMLADAVSAYPSLASSTVVALQTVDGLAKWHGGALGAALAQIDKVRASVHTPSALTMTAAIQFDFGLVQDAESTLRRSREALRTDARGDLARAEAIGARLLARRHPQSAASTLPAIDGVAAIYAAPVLARHAQLLLESGASERAKELLDDALERLPQQRPGHPREGLILLWLAVWHAAKGDHARATAMLEAATGVRDPPPPVWLLLERARAVMKTSRSDERGHAPRTGPLLAVAFSPDGRTLATGGADGTVRLRDPATGEQTSGLEGHTDPVLAVAFSPDGRTLATAGADGTARLWDTVICEQARGLEGHTGPVRAVAFSRDGRTLATAGDDRKVWLWDPATGEPTSGLEGHTDPVLAVAFSPDGRTLATAGADGTARLWDPWTGEQTRGLEGHTDWVLAVAFSPDGRTVATAGGDERVRLWDPVTGKQTRALRGHTDWVLAVAFSPDGRTLATAGDDGTVRLWDPATGEQIRALEGHTGPVWAVAFSPDGRTLASGDDRAVRLWDPTLEMGSLSLVTLSPAAALLHEAATIALELVERHDLATGVLAQLFAAPPRSDLDGDQPDRT